MRLGLFLNCSYFGGKNEARVLIICVLIKKKSVVYVYLQLLRITVPIYIGLILKGLKSKNKTYAFVERVTT